MEGNRSLTRIPCPIHSHKYAGPTHWNTSYRRRGRLLKRWTRKRWGTERIKQGIFYRNSYPAPCNIMAESSAVLLETKIGKFPCAAVVMIDRFRLLKWWQTLPRNAGCSGVWRHRGFSGRDHTESRISKGQEKVPQKGSGPATQGNEEKGEYWWITFYM